ncbi:MAG TPA: adenylate/guanylate cyclase domain-containing protein [Myxococcaceae bacterium]|nr:adenylate/guanylate cyclase domain-containing protein [Myxococcaceae bacterium]
MIGAPAPIDPADAYEPKLDELFRETAASLERRVALVGLGLCLFATVVIVLGRLSGSAVPVRVLWVTVPLSVWYTGVWAMARSGLYRRWVRYVSTTLEVSVASALMLIDLADAGPLYALVAAGPALFAVTATVASLRLDPRLCVYAGVFGTLQYLGIHFLVLPPRWVAANLPPELLDPVAHVVRASFILGLGALGFVATRATRSLLSRLTQTAVERERVRGLFGMHVSEQVMELLLSGAVPDGGERRAVTICFTDIRGFTTLSEARPPEELVRLLNLYFGRMCAIVAKHGGVVNKFLGDGMLIVFGAPAHLPDDSAAALRASREMLAECERMRESGEFPGLRIGVGLHRGEVVVGNVGGDQRREYTVIGDTVNTASRVQDLTKPLARELLFTREVREALGPGHYEPLGQHPVKGRELPVELFTAPTAVAKVA